MCGSMYIAVFLCLSPQWPPILLVQHAHTEREGDEREGVRGGVWRREERERREEGGKRRTK